LKAPPAAPAPPSWTGFYIGAHAGWGWSNGSATVTSFDPLVPGAGIVFPTSYDLNSSGPIFGGQLGYDWQAGNAVLGVEGDFSGAGINGFQTQPVTTGPDTSAGGGLFATGGTSFVRQDINWLASIRGRLGYTWGPGMLYGTGGVAWANVKYSGDVAPPSGQGSCCTAPASFTNTRTGWTVGGGYEMMIGGNWSVRGEYLYYSFHNAAATVPAVVSSPFFGPFGTVTYAPSNLNIHVVRLGLDYKFGAGAADAGVGPGPLAYHPGAATAAPTWTGFYIGAHGGWGWATTTNVSMSSFAPNAPPPIPGMFFLPAAYDLSGNGAVFGGQLGYNFQAGNWLLGAEGDISGAGLDAFRSQPESTPAGVHALTPAAFGTSFMRENVEWLASVRGRIGYAWGPGVVYATGGGAWAGVKYNADSSLPGIVLGCCAWPAALSNTRSGFVVGGGYETMITPNWTVRAEYLYYNFGGGPTLTAPLVSTATGPGGGFVAGSTATYAFGSLAVQVVRLGLNYKF
jgi:outer membrane immunogenic protein